MQCLILLVLLWVQHLALALYSTEVDKVEQLSAPNIFIVEFTRCLYKDTTHYSTPMNK